MPPAFTVVSASSRPCGMAASARAAARMALRPSSGQIPACAALPRKSARTSNSVGAATITSPIGVAWSKTKPNAASDIDVSNSAAPWSPTSSDSVNRSSMPTGAPSTEHRRATSSSTATAALLSAPRIPSFAFSQPSSTTTGSTSAVSATVSRCAHSST
jgi:hypothetical protein